MQLTFWRYASDEEPYLQLVEPPAPPYGTRTAMRGLGFEPDEDDIWWVTLEHLGRKNLSIRAILKRLDEAGISAVVEDAVGEPVDDEAEHEEEVVDEGGTDLVTSEALERVEDHWSEVIGRVDGRLYEIEQRVRQLEGVNHQLLAMLRAIATDTGEAGRRILVSQPPEQFVVDGRSIYLDVARGVPVVVADEEEARQRVLVHLIEHLNIPAHLIISEFRIPRRKDRADIVIRARTDKQAQCVAVIECKAPGIPLNDDVWAQVQRYGEWLKAPYVAITNGSELLTRVYDAKTSAWLNTPAFPSFQSMLDDSAPATWVPMQRSIPRPEYESLLDDFTIRRFADEFAVIPDAFNNEYGHLHFLLNLSSLFFDTSVGPEGLESDGWSCQRDRGLIETSFGNAGYQGHAYSGAYRSLIMSHPDHGTRLVFLRTWTVGGKPPYTMLAIGLHHADGRRHHAMQLNLNRGVTIDEDGFAALRYDGRLSKGGGGSFKRADVIEHLRKRAPDLIEDDAVLLGHLARHEMVDWEDAYPVLVRFMRTALVADELRTNFVA